MKTKTPQVTDILLYSGLIKWLAKNVPAANLKEAGPTMHDAAAWYFANLEAEQIRELSTRELANLIKEGRPSLNTKTAIARILSELWRDEPEPGKTWKDVRYAAALNLITNLKEFFGVTNA